MITEDMIAYSRAIMDYFIINFICYI